MLAMRCDTIRTLLPSCTGSEAVLAREIQSVVQPGHSLALQHTGCSSEPCSMVTGEGASKRFVCHVSCACVPPFTGEAIRPDYRVECPHLPLLSPRL